jgi:hypothetical protein
MTFTKFKLDRKGGSEVLKDMSRPMVNEAGQKVYTAAGEGAEINHYTTDRAGVAVGVPAALQAAHGNLTKAASEAGLEVKAK